MSRFTFAVALIVGGLTASQALPQGQGQGPPKPAIESDLEKTPLQRGIEERIKGRPQGDLKPKCAQAIDDGNQADIAKFCKVKKLKMKKFDQTECPDCGDVLNAAGKRIGKKIRTETVLEFENADQRNPGQLKWENVVLSEDGLAQLSSAIGGIVGGRRRAVVFPGSAVNDDRDCVDTVTQERFGGFVPGTDNLIPDGDETSCFDQLGVLKVTLTALTDGGCQHLSGQIFTGDPSDGVEDACFDAAGNLKTTLEELIDEDGPQEADNDGDGLENEDPEGDLDGDGNPNDDFDCIDLAGTILRDAACFDLDGTLFDGLAELVDEDGSDLQDDDGDGRFDEDPPSQDMARACREFGRALGFPEQELDALLVGRKCDLTRAIKVAANNKAMADFGEKLYKADDKGEDDPNESDGVNFGDEERHLTVLETFTVLCENNAELDEETGQCLVPASVEPSAMAVAAANSAALDCQDDPAGGTCTKRVMMGFTLAPPTYSWGYEIEEEACALGICVELFFARVGYDFEVGLGLRLPAEVEVSGLPPQEESSEAPLAGTSVPLSSTIMPLDFTVQDYKDFCEEHDLDALPTIASCERFSFPSFIEQFDPIPRPDTERDGDEFVARAKVFAGVVVRVLRVPVINWAIGSPDTLDLAGLCTLYLIKERQTANALDALDSLLSAGNFSDLKEALKGVLASCSSFETPFGIKSSPSPIPGQDLSRTFPFPPRLEVRADCAEALVRGETITIRGKIQPRCTNLVLGISGASLGVGLGIEVRAGSDLIRAEATGAGDADPGFSHTVDYQHSKDEGRPPVQIAPMPVDNYDDGDFRDDAVLTLGDFTYFLNKLEFRLFAKLQFGGILSPIPDLPRLTIATVAVSGGDIGIPIPQHAGTEDVAIPFFVKNHGVEVDVSPQPSDPKWVDAKTLAVKPGAFGDYVISVRNIGSVEGSFDEFEAELSNRRNQSAPFTFFIDPNTDFDCEDAAGSHYRGDPTDGAADGCYDGSGSLRADRIARIDEDPLGPAGQLADVRDEDRDGWADEDPADDWRTDPAAWDLLAQTIDDVAPYARSNIPPPGKSVLLRVSPFRHPLTRPGIYPFRVTADSSEAKALGMAAVDPSGNSRIDDTDMAFVQVEAFYDPQVAVQPTATVAKPGTAHLYIVEVANMANVPDSISLAIDFLDFNQVGCGLANMGKDPGCPFRAVPTIIQGPPHATGLDDWTTVSGLPTVFGPFEPLLGQGSSFSIQPPRDWAGMENTTYRFRATTASQADPASPPASNSRLVDLTVIATKESMARYVELELRELIAEIEAANAANVRTGGLLPLTMQAALRQHLRALSLILSDRFANASNALEATAHIMGGFLHQLASRQRRLPAALGLDWQERAEAIVDDLALAAASQVTSTPTGAIACADQMTLQDNVLHGGDYRAVGSLRGGPNLTIDGTSRGVRLVAGSGITLGANVRIAGDFIAEVSEQACP